MKTEIKRVIKTKREDFLTTVLAMYFQNPLQMFSYNLMTIFLPFFRQLNPKALNHWRRLLLTKEQQNENDL